MGSITLLKEFIRLSFEFKTQKKNIKKAFIFIKNNIRTCSIEDILNKNEVKKLKSDALLINLGLLQPFAFLIGRKPTPNETQLQVLISICTAIQDNLIDSSNQEAYNKKIELGNEILNYVRENISHKDLFEMYLSETLNAQNESKKQFDNEISIEEIREITFKKCGNAFLLIRSILSENLIENEPEAIFQYGGTAQIGDDILDLYDDIAINLNTLANKTELKPLTLLFNRELDKTISLFNKLEYPQKNKSKAIIRIVIFLSVFNLALQRYQKLQINSTDWNSLMKLKRKVLILDMERTGFKFRLFWDVASRLNVKRKC
jgi:hypothetical protein